MITTNLRIRIACVRGAPHNGKEYGRIRASKPMDLEAIPRPDRDLLDQLAGVTGVGWTTSVLGFLGTVLGYGNSLVSRFVADSKALLYVGAVLFLATLGLDRLADAARNE